MTSQDILRAAGWHEGRNESGLVEDWVHRLACEGGYRASDAAREFLREFGGLAWPRRGPGEHLPTYAFNFDPLVAEGEEERFAAASQSAGEPLFPLGEAVNGHVFVAITPTGRFHLVMDFIDPVVGDAWGLIDQLLAGDGGGRTTP